jgi:glycerophosphoryl diester phosphodiesterase
VRRERLSLFALLLALAACSEEAPPVKDAGTLQDAGLSGPLPRPTEILSAELYDCTAQGPVVAPARPHPVTCFNDATCTGPLVVGHRMATAFAPENTLSALRAAILLGIDIVETDVRLTRDGHIVLIHDGTIDRTHVQRGTVSELTLTELKEIPLEIPASKSFGNFACDRTPTLEEALSVADGQIVLELEVKDTAAGIAAAEYSRDHDLYDQVFFLCSVTECNALRAAVPDVPIMTRPGAPDEVPANLAFDPKPIMVHIDPTEEFLAPAVRDAIHGAGAKVFGNAFILGDPRAALTDDLGGYSELFQAGLDVLQAERPEWALMTLGRGLE